jgi:branched-chain amino acid transport system permease protein
VLSRHAHWLILLALLPLPLLDLVLPPDWRISPLMRPIFILALLGIGLNVVTGYTGLLNLGVAAFMAVGAYSYGILTCDIYPFQLGFWPALLITMCVGAAFGTIISLPTLRLRGDYLAIVTLGLGEMTQDVLRNLEVITKGTQGINPLPYPNVFGFTLSAEKYIPLYYLLLALLAVIVLLVKNLEKSRIGRAWIALREDELAAACMGVNPVKAKLSAFAVCAALCSLSGALWASYLGSTGEPGNYDFQISILALCMVIVGGMGNMAGVLLGAILMVGFNSIVLVKLSTLLVAQGISSTSSVYTSPNNWKYMVFGLALVLTMRFRPEGLLPSKRVRAEMRHAKDEPPLPQEGEPRMSA